MLCLPQEISQKFKEALKSGELNISKLINPKTTTEERRTAFAKVVGENYAQSVNLMFEKKLMLKNQQAGLIDFVKTVAGLKEQVRKDLIGKITRMDKVFSPTEEVTFLNEVANRVIGDSVTEEEARNIFELSKKVEESQIQGEVKDVEDLINAFEKLDPELLSSSQKKTIKDSRERIEAEKELEAEIKQAEKDKKTELVAEKKQNLLDMKIANGKALTTFRREFETKKISEFPQEIQNMISDVTEKYREASMGKNRLEYGKARGQLRRYVNGLTKKGELDSFKEKPIRSFGGLQKSLAASLDYTSAVANQGYDNLVNHPITSIKNLLGALNGTYETFKGHGEEVEDDIYADIISRPNSLNEYYSKAKLAVGIKEEQHPSSLPEKIPVLGRAFKGAENAFNAYLFKMRADIFDLYIDSDIENGIELTDDRLKALGKLVNSGTGRAHLGSLETVAEQANLLFFSARYLKSTVDTLTAHIFDRDIPWDLKRRAAMRLLKVIVVTGILMTVSNMIKSGSAEIDPRSSDFSKIKVGDTRFRLGGGKGALITLTVRLIPLLWGGEMNTKSTATGKISKINSGTYGSSTGGQVAADFLKNRASPFLTMFIDMLNQQDRNGKPTNWLKEIVGSLNPLPISNLNELLSNPNAAPWVAGLIADNFGFSTNTYSASVSQEHNSQIEDKVKANYEAKQKGEDTKSSKQIAKEIFGDGYDSSQLNKIEKAKQFYKQFGEDNKWANKIKDTPSVNDILGILDDAKKELGDDEFKKFFKKSTEDIPLESGGHSQVLITPAVEKKWKEYEKTGVMDENSGTTGQTDKERSLINIFATGAKAFGTDPIETFKLIFENQSIQRVENGQIIINRNSNFFDTTLGKSGYSEQVKKERDANTNQRLDHTIPVAGGGLEKNWDADNLLLISEKEWKSNTPVETFLINKLKAHTITGPRLREYIIRYKAGRGQAISDRYMDEYNNKYGGKPITFEEIKSVLDK